MGGYISRCINPGASDAELALPTLLLLLLLLVQQIVGRFSPWITSDASNAELALTLLLLPLLLPLLLLLVQQIVGKVSPWITSDASDAELALTLLLLLPLPLLLLVKQIVGKVSPWINPDASDAELAQRSAAALQQELNWAAFLGLQAVLLPTPQQHKGAFNFAQVVNQVRGCTLCMAQQCACLLTVCVALWCFHRDMLAAPSRALHVHCMYLAVQPCSDWQVVPQDI
jgi:hypothetical protein